LWAETCFWRQAVGHLPTRQTANSLGSCLFNSLVWRDLETSGQSICKTQGEHYKSHLYD
jgi:hypothetical protein